MCRVAQSFHADPLVVECEWPLARVWAYAAWGEENDPWVAKERASDGYIAQELNHE